ncbi:MAG TPA: putative metalloprotease CJM1_0395 family protein [Candidatus Ozemobacteraceae bacterium]|nr:putative metalloprotease CJM1_0395 family protein [Candidatus Ozemobacteraceae bacterium]
MVITGAERNQPALRVNRSAPGEFLRPGTDTPAAPATPTASSSSEASENAGPANTPKKAGRSPSSDLDPKALAVVNELKQTDRNVRAHEAAHLAAGRQYVTGGANFEYKVGPDGKQYAVAGEVGIDTSAVPGDPKATIDKMETVRRAALAPSEPSSQDRAVAAAAARQAAQARTDAAEAKQGEKLQPGRLFDRRA